MMLSLVCGNKSCVNFIVSEYFNLLKMVVVLNMMVLLVCGNQSHGFWGKYDVVVGLW